MNNKIGKSPSFKCSPYNQACRSINKSAPVYLVLVFSILFLLFTAGCSLERFLEFSLISSSIPSGGIIGTDRGPIELVFSKNVDIKDAEDTITVEDDEGNPVGIDLNISGNSVTIIPDEEWVPFTRFWLIIDRELKDTYGKSLNSDYYLVFQSTGELIPVSALLVDPEIRNDMVDGDFSAFKIIFSSGVNQESVERGFSITPDLKGHFEWPLHGDLLDEGSNGIEGYEEYVCRYVLDEDPIPNTLYTVVISAEALDINGYNLKRFEKDFEFRPNTPYPALSGLLVDEILIFDLNEIENLDNSEAFENVSLEDRKYIIKYDSAEKDCSVQFEFSEQIDPESFRENVSLVPSGELIISWQTLYSPVVTFDENLDIQQYYELKIARGVESASGLQTLYDYLIELYISGDYSRYLGFYAEDFLSLDIDAGLYNQGSPVDVNSVQLGQDTEGNFIKILYSDPDGLLEPSMLDVNLNIRLLFQSAEYIPDIDELTLQDSVFLDFIMGADPLSRARTGSILGFTWEDQNRCSLNLGNMGNNNIYSLVINGGKGGVLDSYENYMQEDALFYFKLHIVEEN